MTKVKRVLVVGGGVGGLTAATALGLRGIETTLIERRRAFDVPGIGLGQPANALRVYDALGLLDQVLDAGFVYDRMHVFDPNRQMIVDHKFLLGDDRVPAVCALSRLELHNILFGAAWRAGIDVRLGLIVSEIVDHQDGVQVIFSNGETELYDLLVGFDGIRSTTRHYLFGTAFEPRPSGYGAWRVQVPRPDCVRGMEFLQGIGSKTGAMPLSQDLMYVFHIRPETKGAIFERKDYATLLQGRLKQYGSYVADVSAALTPESDIVYSPIEPMMVPWPWFKGRVVIGGDAAHVFPPHLTQGAAMAAEDGYILAQEVLKNDVSLHDRLMSYSKRRYARCAFVYNFALQWLQDEQSIHTPEEFESARAEMMLNGSRRIGASDFILNQQILDEVAQGRSECW
jgi:2-polyprenyl-6-methoxyphenol hydroxylase-like FAD-dependent oxidoreductase